MTSVMTSSNTTGYMTSQGATSGSAGEPFSTCWVLGVGDFIPWNNPGNLISQETERKANTVISLLALGLGCVSVPCNLLNMLVFHKQGLHVRINLCLFTLSLADGLHMFFNFVYNVDILYTPVSQIGPVVRFFVRNHLVGLVNVGWVSAFVAMVIACERCLCVFSPLRSQTILRTKTTAVILVVTILPLVTAFMVIGLRWSLGCVTDMSIDTTFTIFSFGRFYVENKTVMDIMSLLFGTLTPVIFVSVVMLTTVATSIQLRRMATWRRETSSATLTSREVALTRTLIVVSFLFVVCSLPLILVAILSMSMEGFSFEGQYYNFGMVCVRVYELGSYVNATFNFFVYCFLGSRYRATLRSILCGRGFAARQGTKESD